MGGAKSKFEQTDWIRANGNLTNQEQTIDGSRPTSSYGVYYITKTKLNQREFEVTDLEKNLLYSTKPVPGTLCWFDVYGNGIDDCRLRVQVDLTRRFWVIYRMGIPCFSGQLADREATDKFANDRRENGDDLTATPFLFRKCCIAVSWSRYMAVAIQYGEPEGIDLSATADDDESEKGLFRKRFSEASLRALANDDVKREDADEEEKKSEVDQQSVSQSDNNSAKIVFDASLHGSIDSTGSRTEDDPEESLPTSSLTAWVQKQTQIIKDNKKKQLKTDPLEGILHLDKPLLLCQEIYDKLIGNHQSSCLSRKNAIELLREDLEQHKIDGELDGDNMPFLADQEEIFAQIEALRKLEEEQKSATDESDEQDDAEQQQGADAAEESTDLAHDNTNAVNKVAADQGNVDVEPQENVSDQQKGEGQPAKERSSIGESSQHEIAPLEPDQAQSTEEMEQTRSNATEDADDNENEEDIDEDSDLVAYWAWENTWKTHQMKIHLAAGSDLALHVVIAIIANQVRYERNAIAMSI